MENLNPSQLFDAHYYATSCGRPYQRDESWLSFFGGIADQIVQRIQPKTVLDAGCALGFLVEALRQRGVEAYGVDVSEYAIGNVHPSIQPYCWAGSVTDPFPQKYDLIVSIEVLEHMPPKEALKAVENFCKFSDDVLFSSTPFDYKEATHFNVQPPEVWSELFARQGLWRDVDFDASFITAWAVRYRRKVAPPPEIVRDYERKFFLLWKENSDLRNLILEMRGELSKGDQDYRSLQSQADELQAQLSQVLESHAQINGQIQAYQAQLTDQAQAFQTQVVDQARQYQAQLEAQAQSFQACLDELEQANEARLEQQAQGFQSHLEQQTQASKEQLEEQVRASQAQLEDQARASQAQLEDRARASQALQDRLAESQANLAQTRAVLEEVLTSRSWRFMQKFQHIRLKLIPRNSRREAVFMALLSKPATQPTALAVPETPRPQIQTIAIEPVLPKPAMVPHQASVDIIVCVHNALDDVKRCLESIVRYTTAPYSLVLVDDGSDAPTQVYLAEFAASQGATLLRNDQARGYTRAANQGLRQSAGAYAVLLNSDTIVSPGWLDRMVACAESDSTIGVVGPLSNTASWQSTPEIFNQDGDWADNPLPPDMTVAEMAALVDRYSGRLYPHIPFLNGFCLMIKRDLIEKIGYFDEDRFGEGYGEENDYSLRAKKSSRLLAVADDVYIFHAQSRSYSHDRRKQLAERANKALVAKYGQEIISRGVEACRFDRVMEGNRARAQAMQRREQAIADGKRLFEGKRLLFILPITEPGGGSHVVFQEAEAMLKMGVDARVLNLEWTRPIMERGYAENNVPVVYLERHALTPTLFPNYDAVIATVFHSVEWMEASPESGKLPVRGYYIQDFEPNFFSPGSPEYRLARDSYTRFPDLVRMTKTDWNFSAVQKNIGVDCAVVGPSLDIDLFRPRRRLLTERSLRLVAMVRPSTPRRNPELTMRLLGEVARRYQDKVEVVVFGCQVDDPGFTKLVTGFPFRHAGFLTRQQVASLFDESDIFVDFSSYQAMGLTAMEAMACGAAVIVPDEGGSHSFAFHEQNALIVDTSSEDACLAALERLILDQPLRSRLQQQAIQDVCQFPPEMAALNILKALFSPKSGQEM